MTPSARAQAAIELLDEIIAAARDGGPAADTLVARYFKERRYAGSKDRRAVRDLLYDAIRRAGDRPESGRAALVGLARVRPELAALFDGSTHAPTPLTPEESEAPASAVPVWLEPLLTQPLRDALAERAALLERAPLDLRVNRLRADPAEALTAIASDDVKPIPGLPEALRAPEGFPIEQNSAWERGLVEVQDAGSQIISAACDAKPGQTIIDLCAGAGGKTLALAAAMRGQGKLIAADTIRSRLARLTPRAERAGASFIETLLLDQGHEARALGPLASSADVVLVDAPCSGTGTWRRNPEARWRLTPARLERTVAEQARILDLSAQLLVSGGRLVYAVCSIVDREGQEQIDAFLARHPGWIVEPPLPDAFAQWGRPRGSGLLLTPAHDGTDGFFFAVLRKS